MSLGSKAASRCALVMISGLRAAAVAAQAVPVPIPAHNRAELVVVPPRPAPDARLAALGKALFEAIVHDDAERADAEFFPRPAFLLVKAMRDPGRYWEQLHARFARDVHALHETLETPEHAVYDRLELSSRGGFMRVGEEGNRLPYWAARHSWLYYREHGQLRRLEVRVLISWDDRWYVIHLSEFH